MPALGRKQALVCSIRQLTDLLDPRPQCLKGTGKVSDVVPGDLAECVSEGAGLSRIAPEKHDACNEIVSWQWSLQQSIGRQFVWRDVVRPWKTTFGEFLGRSGIEKYGRLVDLI